MRVLHIIADVSSESGGPIEGVLQFGELYYKLGHSQEILSLDVPGTTRQNAVIHAHGRPRPTGHGPIARMRRFARYSPEATQWLRANIHNYDMVVVNGLWNYATRVARKVLVDSGVPYVVFTHGMLDPWFKRTYPLKHAVKSILWRFNEGVLMRGADAIAFTCELERQLARQSFSPWGMREVVVQYGAAEPPASDPASIAAFRAMIPALRDRPFLLYLSRIHEKKGCDLLVEAWAKTRHLYPDADLVIAGPDHNGMIEGLQRRAEALGVGSSIHFPGMVSGNAKWGAFHDAMLFILPSHQENFGIVVAESLACGTPVLISDQVNIHHEITAGGAGFVAPDTVEGTVTLLESFATLSPAERAAMAVRGRTLFEEKFEMGGAARNLVGLFEKIIRGEKIQPNL